MMIARHVLVLSYPYNKRKTVPSLLTPYGLRIMYSMWWVQHRPQITIQAAVCGKIWARFAMQKYPRYDTRNERISVWFIFHCHTSHNVVCYALPSLRTIPGGVPIYTRLRVCTLHIEQLLLLPGDIPHNHCACRFYVLEWYKICGHKTTTQRYCIGMQ